MVHLPNFNYQQLIGIPDEDLTFDITNHVYIEETSTDYEDNEESFLYNLHNEMLLLTNTPSNFSKSYKEDNNIFIICKSSNKEKLTNLLSNTWKDDLILLKKGLSLLYTKNSF